MPLAPHASLAISVMTPAWRTRLRVICRVEPALGGLEDCIQGNMGCRKSLRSLPAVGKRLSDRRSVAMSSA